MHLESSRHNHNQGVNFSLAGPEGVRIQLPFTVTLRSRSRVTFAPRGVERSVPESFAVKMVEWIALAEQRVGIATCDVSSARLGEAVFIPGFRGISPPACAPNSLVTASSGPDSITQGFR